MKNLPFIKFWPGDKVKIKDSPIDQAVVDEVKICRMGVKYQLYYWNDKSICDVVFAECELEELND